MALRSPSPEDGGWVLLVCPGCEAWQLDYGPPHSDPEVAYHFDTNSFVHEIHSLTADLESILEEHANECPELYRLWQEELASRSAV